MGLFQNIRSTFARTFFTTSKRASPENPSTSLSNPDEWLVNWFGGGPSASGISINSDKALTTATVFQAVSMLSADVAKLPINIYERLGENNRRKDVDHPASYIVRHQANEEISAGVFKRVMMYHVLFWGNAFAHILRDSAGRVIELIPLMPDRTEAFRRGGELKYKTAVGDQWRILSASDVFHIRGLSFDGLTGYSVISLARDSLGLTLAAEEFGAKFFSQGSIASGVLSYPGSLSPTAAKNLKDSFEKQHSGLDKSHRTILLEEGARFHPISIPPNDAQFIATRELQRREIASWFNIPPARLGDMDSVSYNSLEQQNQSYLESSLDPWLNTFEEECNNKLLTEKEKQSDSHYFEFNRSALLRTNLIDRYRAYAIGRQWGFLSVNDIRARENGTPIGDQGDMYLVPTNMVPADQITDGPDDEPDDDTVDESASVAREDVWVVECLEAQLSVLDDSTARVLRRIIGSVKKLARDRSDWVARVAGFRQDAVATLTTVLAKPIQSVLTIQQSKQSADDIISEVVDDISDSLISINEGCTDDEFSSRLKSWADELETSGCRKLQRHVLDEVI